MIYSDWTRPAENYRKAKKIAFVSATVVFCVIQLGVTANLHPEISGIKAFFHLFITALIIVFNAYPDKGTIISPLEIIWPMLGGMGVYYILRYILSVTFYPYSTEDRKMYEYRVDYEVWKEAMKETMEKYPEADRQTNLWFEEFLKNRDDTNSFCYYRKEFLKIPLNRRVGYFLCVLWIFGAIWLLTR